MVITYIDPKPLTAMEAVRTETNLNGSTRVESDCTEGCQEDVRQPSVSNETTAGDSPQTLRTYHSSLNGMKEAVQTEYSYLIESIRTVRTKDSYLTSITD